MPDKYCQITLQSIVLRKTVLRFEEGGPPEFSFERGDLIGEIRYVGNNNTFAGPFLAVLDVEDQLALNKILHKIGKSVYDGEQRMIRAQPPK